VTTTATIVSAALGAGHDGRAEVVVELLHANGGRNRVSVPQESAVRALDAAGVTSIDQLVGQPWSVLLVAAPNEPTASPRSPTCST
jgi:hypothetical protein